MSVTSGINHAKQLKLNRALVIDSLRRQQCCSRAELARMANLKRATITNIIGELIDSGLVVETEILNGTGSAGTTSDIFTLGRLINLIFGGRK